MTDCRVRVDVSEIMRYMPHRYPFLLIDRLIEFEAYKRARALKNVTINEPFFAGHFHDYPVMPGVMIIEALAQAAGLLALYSQGYRKPNELYFFVGIDGARFRRQVLPGDQLMLDVVQLHSKRGMTKYQTQALVDGELTCEAQIMCARREV